MTNTSKNSSTTATKHPHTHDSKNPRTDDPNSLLHMKAEMHRLRAEVSRLKRLQQPKEDRPTRDRRSSSLSSRPARTIQQTTTTTTMNEGDLEFRLSQTTNDRHPSVNGLHHRRHPQEFASLLKNNANNSPEHALVSQHSSDSNVGDELESQQQEPEQIVEDDVTYEDASFLTVVMDRAGWLAGLLVLQSLSSFIIQRNEMLLANHAVIIRFLTMLIGAGGNAGNQATVKVIRGLAVGTIRSDSFFDFWKEELKLGLAISGILAVAGCLRVAVFAVPWKETLAITCSLFSIVWISTVLGSLLPMGLQLLHIDPAHSSTTIQVIMDILGVTITVYICSALL